jgi:acetylornithine deacetylase/succinyl-diaminopimelate desuccinylase-like protein
VIRVQAAGRRAAVEAGHDRGLRERFDGIAGALRRVDAAAFGVAIVADPITSYTGVELDAPRWLPAWRTAPGHWLTRAATDAVRRVTGTARTGVYDFCTNGSESAGNRGLPTIGLGPGLAADAHTPDESVSVAQIEQAAAVYEFLAVGAAARASI